jgi:hypothetical protein
VQPSYGRAQLYIWTHFCIWWDSATLELFIVPATGGEPPAAWRDNPPVLSVVSPTPGTSTVGMLPVAFSATDDRGLSRARVLVDGSLRRELSLSGTWASQWLDLDLAGLTAGRHLVTVEVQDTSGQTARQTVPFTIAAGPATSRRVLYTEQASVPEGARLAMVVAQLDPPRGEPSLDYNAFAGYHVPGDVYDVSQYTVVTPGQAHAVPERAETIRWALWAEPCGATVYWDLGGEACVGLWREGNRTFALTWPPALYEMVRDDWQRLVSVEVEEGEALSSAALCDGKVHVLTNQRWLAIDVDTGDIPLRLLGGAGGACARLDGTLYLWADNALYAFTWPSPRVVGDAQYSVSCVLPLSASSFVLGLSTGRVVLGRPGSWQESQLPGCAGVRGLANIEGTLFAAGVGGLWRSTPDGWQRDIAVGILGCITRAMGAVWAAGEGPVVWKLTGTGWQQATELNGVARVYALAEAETTLLLATATTEGAARIYAYSYSEGGIRCGPRPPLVAAAFLRCVR